MDNTAFKTLSSRSSHKVRYGPSGIHVFDRETGLNVLLDEFSVPQAMWADAPRQVSIALTNACDLSCDFCFAPKNESFLEYERLIGWLDELDAHGCMGVGFGGGEPTLYHRLLDSCRYTAEKTSLAVTLTTHAHGLNQDLADALRGNVHFIRVSMDGIDETYEALRGRSFVAFQKQLKIVQGVAPFGINFLVNKRSMPDLNDAVALAIAYGASEFLMLPEQPVRGVGGIDQETFSDLRRWVDKYQGNIRLTVSEVGSEGLPTCNPIKEETGLSAYAHIDASGIFKKTSFDTNGIEINDGSVIQACELLRSVTEEDR